MQPVRVMLVEDNREYRDVIGLALEYVQDVELISQFATAEIALRSLQSRDRQEPDLILLDLRLPGMDGLDALSLFRSSVPNTKIIILTQSHHEKDVLRAISLGASGYLLKTSSVEEIIEGIRTVMSGGATLDAGVAKFILNTLQVRLPKDSPEHALSERELEILALLGEGLVKKEIADRLHIQYSTVDYHVSRIYEKLNVKNAPAAVNKAHKLGLFPPG